ARDQRRPLVMHAVPDHPRGVVAWMAGQEQLAGEAVGQFVDGGLLELDFRPVERYGRDGGVGARGCGSLLSERGEKRIGTGDAGSQRRTAELTSVHGVPPAASTSFCNR